MSVIHSFFLQSRKRKGRFYNPVAMASVKSLDKLKILDAVTSRVSQDDEDSWVELAPPSRGSLCSSIDAIFVVEAAQQQSNPSSKGSRHSPKSLHSPNGEFETFDEVMKDRLARDMLPPGRNTDWIWDWSSRPEAIPPKDIRFRPVSGQGNTSGNSALTTPPNSPAPNPLHKYPWSLRHGKFVKSDLFRVEVIFGLVVSNLVTFLLGACIGFCICRKLSHDSSMDPH